MINQTYTTSDYEIFCRAMNAMSALPPKRITVTTTGQAMLSRFLVENPTHAFHAVPASLVEDQFSPYIGHSV